MVDWDHLGAVAARSVARHAAVFALTGGAGTPFAVFADLMDLLDGVDALDAVDAADAGSSTSSTGGHHEISFTGHGTGGGLGAGAYPDLYYDPTNEVRTSPWKIRHGDS